jgi:hypothetical protein
MLTLVAPKHDEATAHLPVMSPPQAAELVHEAAESLELPPQPEHKMIAQKPAQNPMMTLFMA